MGIFWRATSAYSTRHSFQSLLKKRLVLILNREECWRYHIKPWKMVRGKSPPVVVHINTDRHLAGIPLTKCSGSDCSVYTGTFTDDYRSIMFQDSETEHRYGATGLSMSMIANRVSWFFNFKGPSMNLDSACSSSLTALHLACQDLRTGESSMVSSILLKEDRDGLIQLILIGPCWRL